MSLHNTALRFRILRGCWALSEKRKKNGPLLFLVYFFGNDIVVGEIAHVRTTQCCKW